MPYTASSKFFYIVIAIACAAALHGMGQAIALRCPSLPSPSALSCPTRTIMSVNKSTPLVS
eukprot:592699-Pleurochrysis_carterae.AAC.1